MNFLIVFFAIFLFCHTNPKWFLKILKKFKIIYKENTKIYFYLCAYDQILKVFMNILYKKNEFLSYFEKYKNQLIGIITSL
jgi:hypothetical protein